ncbi:MAG TPA: beta-hydroxyacyl-ACP dehydratase, partial [Bacillus sp. (in: Bacteria)]|nr:beta-hydroxyacyl-ACP dehydratase [Bacillus sp. (in: firmicutes)]
MELEKILEVVPIRKPMLCIDNICEVIYGQSAKGYRNIKRDEDWAKG